MRGMGKRLFEDEVDLWRDDQDPHSLSTLRARVLCTERAWTVSLRFFVRVNGVMARVIDTRLQCRGGEVLRERSWREGDWATLVGQARRRRLVTGGGSHGLAGSNLCRIS